MFNRFKTITYTIDDKDLSVKDLSNSFDLTNIKNLSISESLNLYGKWDAWP